MGRDRSPPVAIGAPLAALKGGAEEDGEEGPGKMLNVAPVSAKNLTPVVVS